MCELRSLVHSALEVSSSGEQESFNLFLPPLGRNRLFWKTKQRAKNENWKYYWTHNGSILAKKDDDTDAIPIKSDLDLDLIKN